MRPTQCSQFGNSNHKQGRNDIKLQTVVTPLGEVAVALFDTMPTGTAVLFDPSIMAPVHQMVPGKGNFFLEQLAKTGAGETFPQIFRAN